jgi:hypothetical protein
MKFDENGEPEFINKTVNRRGSDVIVKVPNPKYIAPKIIPRRKKIKTGTR